MTRYFVTRLLAIIPMVVGTSLLLFFLMQLAPGGPEFMMLGGVGGEGSFTPEMAAQLREQMGLNDPIYVQYGRWFGSAIRGNLGRSLFKQIPVLSLIAQKLGPTAILTATALAIAIAAAIPLGIVSATRRYSLLDHTVTSLALFGISLPSFWLGIILVLIFAVHYGLFPISGIAPYGKTDILTRMHHLVLPAFTLAALRVAIFTRFVRSSTLEVLESDYIRTARAKGLFERTVIYKHALRNALIPIVTVVGLQLPSLIGGAAVVETVFAYAGIGLLAVESTRLRDYPVIMGISMLVAVAVILSNLVIDLLYAIIDPRIRYE